MPYKPGQSGNLKGRPKGGRALTEILQTALEEIYGADKIALKQIMAQKISRAMATGIIEFPNGKKVRRVKLDSEQWFQFVKFIYTHIDGPARVDLNLNATMNNIVIVNNIGLDDITSD